MATSMMINGREVTVTSLQRRTIGKADGTHTEEWRISALVRGLAEQRAFLDLLSQGRLRLEMPGSDQSSPVDGQIISAVHTEAGDRRRVTFRHSLCVVIEQEPLEQASVSA